jgi:hypothetical protein
MAFAKHNVKIHGVENKIEHICGDYFGVMPRCSADVVFLSPSWGGPDHARQFIFDVDSMGGSLDTADMMKLAANAVDNVVLYISKTSNLEQVRISIIATIYLFKLTSFYLEDYNVLFIILVLEYISTRYRKPNIKGTPQPTGLLRYQVP